MFRGVAEYIKDAVFPYFCVSCGKEKEWWCEKCRAGENQKQILNQDVEPLNSVTALFNYKEGDSIAKLIKLFKFDYVLDLEKIWKILLAELKLAINNEFVVVPVPLHSRRLRERGFNQAEILAKITCEIYKLDLSFDLKRIRKTAQQSKLSKEDRISNVHGAFSWKGAGKAPKRILIIDDVYTTGSTMKECARILKENGAMEVCGLVLAHG